MATYTGRDLTDVQSARTAENLSIREASLRRALAAIQAMSEVGRQSSAERIAGNSAANEAMRLTNNLTLGREQYGSNERVAGLERLNRLELGQLQAQAQGLPFTPEARAHALDIARLGVRPDPYVTRDIGQANIESIAMNDLAKSIAESANLTIDREEAELLKDLPGWDKWDRDTKIKDGLTRIITGLDAKLGENRQLLEFVPSTNRYKPRVRAIIPIPTGQFGPTQNGLPTVPPPRQNLRMMEDSVPLNPVPVPYGPTSGTFSPPLGRVAVPVTQPVVAASPVIAAPMAVPQALPQVPMNRGIVTPQQVQAWQQKAAVEAAFQQRYLDAMRAASQQYAPPAMGF